MTTEEARAFFVDEIRNGLVETRGAEQVVFPGFIKIAAEASLEASPLHLFEAVAYAANETDCAIEMHTEAGAAIEDFFNFSSLKGCPRRGWFSAMWINARILACIRR